MGSDLPDFPVDDATLLAVEHAMGGALTYDRPDHVPYDSGDEGPWLVGADFSLSRLLDFLAGCTGRDPHEELIHSGDPDLPDYAGAEVVYDTRPHYSEHDLIRALIAEVRRLRAEAALSEPHT